MVTKSGAEGADKYFTIENGQFFRPPNPWQMMIFLNPLDALIPQIPFSFFTEFWVRATSGARGSVSVGFLGGTSIQPFGGGVLASGLCRPPPPQPSTTLHDPPQPSTTLHNPPQPFTTLHNPPQAPILL